VDPVVRKLHIPKVVPSWWVPERPQRRNTIALGAADLIAHDHGNYLWGIGISGFPGCLLSGLMIRDNVVPSVNVIYNTDGVNGISANVIEQNSGLLAADISDSRVSGAG
jgi:hypothetical protein